MYSQYLFLIQVGIELTTAAKGTVHEKSLKLGNGARKQFTTGQIVNLVTTDSQNLNELLPKLNMVTKKNLFTLSFSQIVFIVAGLVNATANSSCLVLLVPRIGHCNACWCGYSCDIDPIQHCHWKIQHKVRKKQ